MARFTIVKWHLRNGKPVKEHVRRIPNGKSGFKTREDAQSIIDDKKIMKYVKHDASKYYGSGAGGGTGGSGGGSVSVEKDYDKASEKAAASITDDLEKRAIKRYTDTDYYEINRCRRKKIDCQNVNKQVEAKLITALDKADKFDGTVYRGTSIKSAKKYREFVDSLKVGGVYHDKGFMSTSTQKKIAHDFEGEGWQNIRFTIKSKRGVAVAKMSEFARETEVLFNAGMKWKIKGYKKVDDGIEVELEDL